MKRAKKISETGNRVKERRKEMVAIYLLTWPVVASMRMTILRKMPRIHLSPNIMQAVDCFFMNIHAE